MIQQFNEFDRSDRAKDLMKRLLNDAVINESYQMTNQQES